MDPHSMPSASRGSTLHAMQEYGYPHSMPSASRDAHRMLAKGDYEEIQ
ncbi:MAG: hypothetical protein WCC17_06025 [Candidatus Nitrosopolaris sp.]